MPDRHLRLLSNAERLARMGSWQWDPETDTLTWSRELYRIYGLEPGTRVTFQTFLEHVHPADQATVREVVTSALRERKPFQIQERIVRPDGEERLLESQGDVELDGDRLVSLFGVCRDVTEETRARGALREYEERFAKIFHASPAATVITQAASGRILDANPRFLELIGEASRDAIIGRTTLEAGLWKGLEERDQMRLRLRSWGVLREMEVHYRTREGQQRRALAAIEPISFGGEDCLLKLFWRG